MKDFSMKDFSMNTNKTAFYGVWAVLTITTVIGLAVLTFSRPVPTVHFVQRPGMVQP